MASPGLSRAHLLALEEGELLGQVADQRLLEEVLWAHALPHILSQLPPHLAPLERESRHTWSAHVFVAVSLHPSPSPARRDGLERVVLELLCLVMTWLTCLLYQARDF